MRWKPSTAQLEAVIDAANARMPLAHSAALVGVGERTLRGFQKRLELAHETTRATDTKVVSTAELATPPEQSSSWRKLTTPPSAVKPTPEPRTVYEMRRAQYKRRVGA